MRTTSVHYNLFAGVKVAFYFLVIILAAGLAGRVPALDSIIFYFSVAFLVSYLLLRTERRPITALGFVPKGSRDWSDFLHGMILGIIALVLTAGATIAWNGGRLKFTGHVDLILILILLLIHLWSAFAQEFTYRGYPFQTLLASYGPWIAQIAVTIPFALMHLKLNAPFTMNQFLMTWLTTGLGSLLYGFCCIRTRKLILPIGVHMGWNFAQALLPRSGSESSTMLFTLSEGKNYHSLHVLLPYLGVTLALMIYIAIRVDRRNERTSLKHS